MFDRKAYDRQYYLDNRERKREYWRQYHKDNHKKRNEYTKQWRLDNPEYQESYNKAHKEYLKQYRMDHREQRKECSKQWSKDNPERKKENDRRSKKRRYRANPQKFKDANFKYKYGLSHEDWLEMWENQDRKCAICRKSFNEPFDACVDHNHDTGEIRGLLCKKCNLGIGHFNDDPKLTARVTEYLLKEVKKIK